MRVALYAAIAFVCIGAASLFWAKAPESTRTPASIDGQSLMEQLKGRIQVAMERSGAIDYTVAHNPNAFGCMVSTNGDCSGRRGLVFLYEDNRPEAQALSQIHPGHGLAVDGLGCTGFPSPECPIRIEADWTPICAPGRCERTKSFYLNAKLIWQEGSDQPPQDWYHKKMLTPDLKLSAAVLCERDGGTYTGITCRRGEAPVAQADTSSLPSPTAVDERERGGAEAPMQNVQFRCPDFVTINGQSCSVEGSSEQCQVERSSSGTVQVGVPTASGCNGQGVDTFNFQCIAKAPASFEGEGQWVQISAVLAPSCDANGQPLAGPGPSL